MLHCELNYPRHYPINQFHVKLSKACYPYFMDFFEIFASSRCHTDIKILKILASNSKRFRFYDIKNTVLTQETKKWHQQCPETSWYWDNYYKNVSYCIYLWKKKDLALLLRKIFFIPTLLNTTNLIYWKH